MLTFNESEFNKDYVTGSLISLYNIFKMPNSLSLCLIDSLCFYSTFGKIAYPIN